MFNSCAKRKRGQDSESTDDGNSSTNSSNGRQMLPSIFVKIPLEINQQYQNRNTSKTNLIKSEVKFESNDPSNLKTPTPPASTPTPPASSTTPERPLSLPSISTIHGTSNLFGDSNRSAATVTTTTPIVEEPAPTIYRCELCPFISIYETSLYSHIDEHTQRKFLGKKYFCPGCDNIHYEKGAMETHLAQDHQMTIEETRILLEHILKYNSFGQSRKTRGKGRISIKNATQLKKPDLLLENGQDQVNNVPVQTKTQPKIFVKKVEYLKGPQFCFNSETCANTNTNGFEFHVSDPPFTSIFDSIPIQNPEEVTSYDTNIEGFDPIMLNQTELPPPETPESVKTSNSGKIYLKDISVLQDPRPIEPTIHLKTVDELNAMAFNPNITTFQNTYAGPDCFSNVNTDIINLESDISDLIELHNDDNYSQNSFTALLNHDFDSVTMETEAKKVECGPSSGPANENLGENVGNLDENDEDILFVCAQEIINANMEGTEEKTRDLETPVPTIVSKPRIYLASNLTNDFVSPAASSIPLSKHKQGRPKGARKSGVSQWRKNLPANITEDDVLGPRCQIDGCALRFKFPKNMDYHRQCHSLMENGETVCPECRSAEFKNWNTLHTHLWRTHNIDMELYACDKCSFKTPILGRLKSEHMKIHSDVLEYKCNTCGKGFKNNKQRKHHVRMHRLRTNPVTAASSPVAIRKPLARKCNQCPMTFPNTVALETHIIDMHIQVTEKKDLLSNLPGAVTQNDAKKYKCPECNYKSNDHNAFRRHKFQHSKDSLYKCPFCTYSSIQSSTYRNHLEKQHPDKAANFVFKCQFCKFTTISKQKFDCHVTRHNLNRDQKNINNNAEIPNKPEIKVRQILTLTDPIDTEKQEEHEDSVISVSQDGCL